MSGGGRGMIDCVSARFAWGKGCGEGWEDL